MSIVKKYIMDSRSGRMFLLPFAVLLLLVAASTGGVYAQGRQTPVTVEGAVKSTQRVPVMGAQVLIQESTTFAVTDEFGNFSIVVPGVNAVITIEADGFEPLVVTIVDDKFLDLTLEFADEGQSIKDRVYVPWGISDKRSVTGSVSTIHQDQLRKSPVVRMEMALSGRLPGFTVINGTGEPGFELYEWRIRGIRTLENGGFNAMEKGGYGSPIIVIDGFELNNVYTIHDLLGLDASEVESFSVLKDAASTALFGMRGANGVIYITTKRGQANKRTIDLEVSSGIISPLRLPNYLNSYDYATLYNEARVNDGMMPLYSEDDLLKYQNGTNPLTHPDNDYYGEFIKPYSLQRKIALTMSGGNKIIRYFVAVNHSNTDGLYNRMNEAEDLVTQSSSSWYNLRTNLDITVSKRLSAALTLAGRIEDRRYPYDGESAIFGDLSGTPPNAYPLSFTGVEPTLNQEILMLGGNTMYTTNPLGRLSYRGLNNRNYRYYHMGMAYKYKLDFITDGLTANFEFNSDGYNYYRIAKYKQYRVWDRVIQPDESLEYIPYNTETSLTTAVGTTVQYYNGTNLFLNYDREFGVNAFKVFAGWRRYNTVYAQANQPNKKIEDFSLRTNYSYDNRYFLEGTAVLTGSDNFYFTSRPRILLPAVSGAWIVSEESFLKSLDAIQFLKLRASWGITANEEYTYTDPNGYKYRFPYRDRWWSSGNRVRFGTSLVYYSPIVYEGVMPNEDFTVEKGRMINLGIDMKHFDDRLSFSTEVWFEKRFDIYSRGVGSVPLSLGKQEDHLPIENEGILFSKGFETTLGWNGTVSNFSYWINGMVDYYTNRIENMDEPFMEYDYLYETGGMVRQNIALIAIGLFKDQADIDNSPVQTFGPYQPGDIKFMDMNDDGVIDANDMTSVGYSTFPQLSYAMDIGFRLKNIDFSVLFQGSAMRSVINRNNVNQTFRNNSSIAEYALGRYTDEASWATATYPRLTTIANDNNYRGSTFWMYEMAFIRVKNLELGYNLSETAARKLGLYGVRFYVNGFNLFTLDKVKDFDPEEISAGISSYPMTSIVNLGINLKF